MLVRIVQAPAIARKWYISRLETINQMMERSDTKIEADQDPKLEPKMITEKVKLNTREIEALPAVSLKKVHPID